MKNETQNNNIQVMKNAKWLLQEPTFYSNRRRVNVEDEAVVLRTIFVIEDYTDNKEEAEAIAKLIVNAVNNFEALKKFAYKYKLLLQNQRQNNGISLYLADEYKDTYKEVEELLNTIQKESA